MILLDSDHLSILLDQRDERWLSLDERLEKAQDVAALPIVCSRSSFVVGWR
jgi:hypothetical protein